MGKATQKRKKINQRLAVRRNSLMNVTNFPFYSRCRDWDPQAKRQSSQKLGQQVPPWPHPRLERPPPRPLHMGFLQAETSHFRTEFMGKWNVRKKLHTAADVSAPISFTQGQDFLPAALKRPCWFVFSEIMVWGRVTRWSEIICEHFSGLICLLSGTCILIWERGPWTWGPSVSPGGWGDQPRSPRTVPHRSGAPMQLPSPPRA